MNYKPGEQVKGAKVRSQMKKHKQREPRKTNRKLTQRHTVCTYYKLTELKEGQALKEQLLRVGQTITGEGQEQSAKQDKKIYKEGTR